MKTLNRTISNIGDLDCALMEKTQRRLDSLTKPQGSLGRLEELAKHIAGITGKENPSLRRKVIVTMAGDHGVTEEKISAYPREVTPQMLYNFLRGGAGINVLARLVGARVVVVDMGICADLDLAGTEMKGGTGVPPVKNHGQDAHATPNSDAVFRSCKIDHGTKNFTRGPAMSRHQAVQCVERGIEVVETELSKGLDILGTGDMGIGNTTASAAVISVLAGLPVAAVAGRGTGVDDATLARKIGAIEKGIAVNRPDPTDAIDVLAKIGGFEIGGLAGVMLAGAAHRVPVVADGFISGAAAMIAAKLAPKAKDFLIAGHCSAEKGHRACLNRLGLSPLLDLNMRLGEGTGAALAMQLAEAAVRILTEMATFESAGVSKKL